MHQDTPQDSLQVKGLFAGRKGRKLIKQRAEECLENGYDNTRAFRKLYACYQDATAGQTKEVLGYIATHIFEGKSKHEVEVFLDRASALIKSGAFPCLEIEQRRKDFDKFLSALCKPACYSLYETDVPQTIKRYTEDISDMVYKKYRDKQKRSKKEGRVSPTPEVVEVLKTQSHECLQELSTLLGYFIEARCCADHKHDTPREVWANRNLPPSQDLLHPIEDLIYTEKQSKNGNEYPVFADLDLRQLQSLRKKVDAML